MVTEQPEPVSNEGPGVWDEKERNLTMTPREAKTFEQICELDRDNVDTDEHWMILDSGGDEITLAAQQLGKPSSAKISMPRATFEAFIDWYNTGTFRKPRAKRKAK